MRRNLVNMLENWKNDEDRKPLILQGARQVGKTWLMKEFGRTYFENFAYINFDNNPRMAEIFEHSIDPARLIPMLGIEAGVDIKPETTLIIFDEVQEVPRAITSLKYFCEDAPEYAVIAAGSFLGVALHKSISFPVGKVNLMTLYPLSYYEFLLAMGEDGLAQCLENKDYECINAFSTKYIEYLRLYYYIGGMPEAVAKYAENKGLNAVREIQKNILNIYANDFSKHIPSRELARVNMVWNSIPMQLAKENKKFFFGQIKQGARSKDYELAIEWLRMCGLIHLVYRVSKPAVPLKAYTELSAFKIYLLDVGLLGAMADLDAKTILEGNSLFVEFKGAMAEQYVLQQLVAETEYTPCYYSPSPTSEIDFMLQINGEVVPVEVKAEENLKAKSLKLYCEKHQPSYAVRTSLSNYRAQEWMTNLPLYAIRNV